MSFAFWQTVQGCHLELTSFIQQHTDVYFNVYYWFRVIFIHLVPCSALVLLTVLLVNAMRRAQRRKNQLLKQNRRSESRRLAETNYTTLMLVIVVCLFLLVEFPLAVLLVIYILHQSFDLNLTDPESNRIATLFVNMVITLSYPLNFIIYCAMSQQFRSTFKSMFCTGNSPTSSDGSTVDNGTNRTNYIALPANRTNYIALPANESRVATQTALNASDSQI
jgi:Serpentine type 7TM GPCR chemoreceptor Srw